MLWESLGAGGKEECLKVLKKGANWAIWCKANQKDKGEQCSVNTAYAYSRVGVRSPKVTVNTKKEHHEEGTSQELEAGGNGDDSKDELKVDLQGLERHFWLGTEAGRLGCHNFPGETWAGDGSVCKGVMGAGSVCLQQQSKYLEVRVGQEEEGVNSLRPELAAMARTLQATPTGVDLLYLCDSETALQKVSWWIGSGPRITLAGDANADIMTVVISRAFSFFLLHNHFINK